VEVKVLVSINAAKGIGSVQAQKDGNDAVASTFCASPS
jgi:hypothetical protein